MRVNGTTNPTELSHASLNRKSLKKTTSRRVRGNRYKQRKRPQSKSLLFVLYFVCCLCVPYRRFRVLSMTLNKKQN